MRLITEVTLSILIVWVFYNKAKCLLDAVETPLSL